MLGFVPQPNLPRFLIKFLDIFYPAMIRRVQICNLNPMFYIF